MRYTLSSRQQSACLRCVAPQGNTAHICIHSVTAAGWHRASTISCSAALSSAVAEQPAVGQDAGGHSDELSLVHVSARSQQTQHRISWQQQSGSIRQSTQVGRVYAHCNDETAHSSPQHTSEGLKAAGAESGISSKDGDTARPASTGRPGQGRRSSSRSPKASSPNRSPNSSPHASIKHGSAANLAENSASTRSSSGSTTGAHHKPFLNVRLKTFPQLQRLLASHGPSARISDCAAMMSRLKSAEWRSPADKTQLFDQLWQYLLPQLPHAAARHCAEVMLTASRLGHAPDGLYEACLQRVSHQVEDAEARIMSNVIYAIATAPSSSVRSASQQQVQQELLPAFLARLHEGNSQSVANVAYALAVLSYQGAGQQLHQLLQAAQPSLWADATAQEVSNVIWAAGSLSVQLPQQHQAALLQRALTVSNTASAQDITNIVYGLAQLQQQLPQQQHQQLATSLLQKAADSQAIGGFLWSSAKMGLALKQRQVNAFAQQLLKCAKPASQSITLALWGVATMERELPHVVLLQLLRRLAAGAPDVRALGLSLWAAAKLKAELPLGLLDELYGLLAPAISAAEPQSVSNSLWAAAVMLPQPYMPTALLGTQHLTQEWRRQQRQRQGGRLSRLRPGQQRRQQQQRQQRQQERQQRRQKQVLAGIAAKVADMKPMELSNVAVALAWLGVKELRLLKRVVDAAIRHLQGPDWTHGNSRRSSSSDPESCSESPPGHLQAHDVAAPEAAASARAATPSSAYGSSSSSSSSDNAHVIGVQALANICWAAAILDLREREEQVRQLAHAASVLLAADSHGIAPEEGTQLYQVHLWLTELVGVRGLSLSPQHLQQCRESMRAAVAGLARPSQQQRQVYEAARRVRSLRDVHLEALTEDGLLSVDVAAVLELPRRRQGTEGQQAGAAGHNSSKGAGSDHGSSSSSSRHSAVLGDTGLPAAGKAADDACCATDDASAVHSDADVMADSATAGGNEGDVDDTGSSPLPEGHAPEAGRKIAIEFDGPFHFRRPDQHVTGPTTFRNRLLAQRGFVVVSVPYWQWQALQQSERVLYLQRAVHDAVRRQTGAQ